MLIENNRNPYTLQEEVLFLPVEEYRRTIEAVAGQNSEFSNWAVDTFIIQKQMFENKEPTKNEI